MCSFSIICYGTMVSAGIRRDITLDDTSGLVMGLLNKTYVS
jgi:hypothetical protein